MKAPLAIAGLFLLAAVSVDAQFLDPVVLESPNAQTDGAFGAEGVTWVPDVNGDGLPDIVVPAIGEFGWSGRVYVFDGVTRDVLSQIQPPSGVSGAEFGAKVAGIGDVNGNGSGDVIIGTHGNQNTVYVFDGLTRRQIHASIFLRVRSVSAVPDCTGDGIPDILAGASGTVVIHNGATGARHKTLGRPAGSTNIGFGWSVAGVADINGDGLGDAIVGDFMGQRAYAFDGSTGELLHTLSAPPGSGSGSFGRSVAGLTDANGDGLGDIAVGASDSSVAYLYDGALGRMFQTLRPPSADNAQQFGWVVEEVPDITGDGLSDVAVIGRPSAEPTNTAYLFDGALRGPSLVGLPGNDEFGGGDTISGVPDLNGDGRGEVLVANHKAVASGFSGAGHVLLYLSEPPALNETQPIVTVSGDTVSVNWDAGIYDRLQVSTDHQSWEDVADLDARTADSHAEPLGLRGNTSLFRLVRD